MTSRRGRRFASPVTMPPDTQLARARIARPTSNGLPQSLLSGGDGTPVRPIGLRDRLVINWRRRSQLPSPRRPAECPTTPHQPQIITEAIITTTRASLVLSFTILYNSSLSFISYARHEEPTSFPRRRQQFLSSAAEYTADSNSAFHFGTQEAEYAMPSMQLSGPGYELMPRRSAHYEWRLLKWAIFRARLQRAELRLFRPIEGIARRRHARAERAEYFAHGRHNMRCQHDASRHIAGCCYALAAHSRMHLHYARVTHAPRLTKGSSRQLASRHIDTLRPLHHYLTAYYHRVIAAILLARKPPTWSREHEIFP